MANELPFAKLGTEPKPLSLVFEPGARPLLDRHSTDWINGS
jgi:hypothetical protein